MKKRVLSWIMAIAVAMSMIPTAVFADTAQTVADQIGQYYEVDDSSGALPTTPALNANSTEQSYAGGAVKVNKTIAATGTENLFDVTLKVTTTEHIEVLAGSADAAVVLVIDCSGSMDNNDKMSQAERAAQAFINSYAEEGASRKIAIVRFSGNDQLHDIDGARTVQSWTDASNLKTKNRFTLCSPLSNLYAEGGTNLQAGLLLAKNLLNSSEVANIANKNIILLSDGEPTYGVNAAEAQSTSTSVICADSYNMTGTGYESQVRCAQHEPVETLVPQLNAAGMTTYSVYIGSGEVYCTQCKLSKSAARWLASCGFTSYSVSDLNDLAGVFEGLSEIIDKKAEAWIVTDPMGDAVDFVQFNRTPNPVNEFQIKNDVITWDIKAGSIPTVAENGSVTTYTYTLSYRIKLNTLANGYREGVYYATNKVTSLTYMITKGERDIETYEFGTAYFNIPSVKGYAGDLSFLKVGSENEALPGAEFTLSTTGWSKTVTSDGSGQVEFSSIPSGHSYVLTESKAPVGYTKDDGQYTVEVSFGDVSVNGQKPENMVVTNRAETVQISGVKTWVDNDNLYQTRPDSITVVLLANGDEVERATVTDIDGTWSYDFGQLPLYKGGQKIEYQVLEIPVEGYTTAANGYNLVNTIKQDYIAVSGTKTWIAPEGTVYPDITINLYRDGSLIDSTVLQNGKTQYTFAELEKYDLTTGREYAYTVKEAEVEGYTSAQDGYNFVNTVKQDTVTVSGTKTWVAPEGTVYPDITINLYRDGSLIDSAVLQNGETQYTFADLVKYDLTDGHEYVYTVKEAEVEGYTSAQDGYNFVNTIKQDFVTVSGTKTWVAPEGTVYPDITINLYRDGNLIDSAVLQNGETEYAFDELVKYDLTNGREYVYTVKEAEVEGFTSVQDGNNFVNTINQAYVDISGTKTWKAPKDAKLPDITINLLVNGKIAQSVVLKDGATEYTFEDVALFSYNEDGTVVINEFAVSENPVEGYTAEIDGFDITNIADLQVPDTGDSTDLTAPVALMTSSAIALVVFGVIKKRKTE